MMAIGSNSCVHSTEALQKLIKANEDGEGNEEYDETWKNHAIDVRLFDTSWIFNNSKMFVDFVDILDQANYGDLYITELVKSLLALYWDENFWMIFFKLFIPYLFYLFGILYFMTHQICKDFEGTEITKFELIIGSLCMTIILY